MLNACDSVISSCLLVYKLTPSNSLSWIASSLRMFEHIWFSYDLAQSLNVHLPSLPSSPQPPLLYIHLSLSSSLTSTSPSPSLLLLNLLLFLSSTSPYLPPSSHPPPLSLFTLTTTSSLHPPLPLSGFSCITFYVTEVEPWNLDPSAINRCLRIFCTTYWALKPLQKPR